MLVSSLKFVCSLNCSTIYFDIFHWKYHSELFQIHFVKLRDRYSSIAWLTLLVVSFSLKNTVWYSMIELYLIHFFIIQKKRKQVACWLRIWTSLVFHYLVITFIKKLYRMKFWARTYRITPEVEKRRTFSSFKLEMSWNGTMNTELQLKSMMVPF